MGLQRGRSRKVSTPVQQVYTRTPPGDTINLGWTSTDSLIEAIDDTVGNRSQNNPCTHVKTSVLSSPSTSGVSHAWSDGSIIRPTHPFIKDLQQEFSVPDLSNTEVQDFLWDAFLNATTAIPHTVEIPNFLVELKDFSSLFRRVRSLWEAYRNGTLSWEFAIKPFISDIQNMMNVSRDLRKRILFLKKTYGKEVPIRYRRIINVEHSDGPLDKWGTPGFETWELHLLTKTIPVASSSRHTLVSIIVIKQELEGLDDALRQLDALLAALGFNNLWNTWWQALPFSFVFEWFVNVEHLLDSFAVNPFKGYITVKRSSFSHKRVTLFDDYSFDQVFTTGEIVPISAGRTRQVVYSRVNGTPLSSIVFLEDGLTDLQKLLLLLLLG